MTWAPSVGHCLNCALMVAEEMNWDPEETGPLFRITYEEKIVGIDGKLHILHVF